MKVLGGDLLSRSVGRIMDSSAPIELSLISKQIETAQKRIEWANFDSRKNVVDYDDVMTRHREVFYSKRYKILELAEHALGKFPNRSKDTGMTIEEGEIKELQEQALLDLKAQIKEMVQMYIYDLVDVQFQGDKLLSSDGLENLVNHILGLAPDVHLAQVFGFKLNELKEMLKNELMKRSVDSAKEYLWDGFSKLVRSKEDEFAEDYANVSRLYCWKLWISTGWST
jgi:preprotein translocase subunit SecA